MLRTQLAFHTRAKGFTIVELMITLAIVAIVLTTVGPSVQSILIQNRIVSEINELSGIIQYARNNAIDEQIDTIVCPSTNYTDCTNDWDNAKMVFSDLNLDGKRNADEELLVASSVISDNNNLTGPAQAIRFAASGMSNLSATLLLCHKDKDDKYARALMITLQGRVKSSRDSDNNNIHEDTAGNQLDCS